ncbi:vegetative cell wall protein gp1-like [Peromyscus leucopus]|uniref:vegetative cell wall protein gp1-like n=1 Tax=Peromyscus leucopus TaxID=10041 RepID=UPI001885281E|nr:vegetative cell wall protein gp1-like [Peromyscus leucopus]
MAKGRREGQTQSPNSRPDATAGFPQRRFTAKEAETPAGAGREGRGIAAPNAPSGQPDPTKAGEPGLHAPSPPRPESRTRETPLPVPHTPRAQSKAAPRPHPHGEEGRGRSRGYLARARPAPFSTTARAPAPPLIGGTRARPSVRTGTTLSSPSRTECGPAPPPIATHGKPRSAPPKNTRPPVPGYPPPSCRTDRGRGVLSPQKLQPLSLRVAPGVSLAPSTEAPERRGHRPARADWQPPLRSRSGHRPECPDWEGGREGGKLQGGKGRGEDGETVSAASTAAAASLLPGKSRPLSQPAPPREGLTSLRHGVY